MAIERGSGRPRLPRDIAFRQAGPADLPACAEVWRAGLTDYGLRVGRPPMPPSFGPFLDVLGHLLATDPDGFVVATARGATGDGAPVAFGSAIRRGTVWFLSMLFVLPEVQGLGIGRALLEAILPAPGEGRTLATCTDSAQPISNALYSRYGIVPRLPVVELVGSPDRAGLPPLPEGVRAVPITGTGTAGTAALDRQIAAIDRATLGYEHPQDHRYLGASGRIGYRYEDAAGSVVGYGYVAPSGRVGPIAVLDEGLLPATLGHLLGDVKPAGVFSVWVPGAAAAAVRALLGAGFRIEDFPAILCWDRPFAAFERYLPITLAVL